MGIEPRLPGLRLALIDLARGTRIRRSRGPCEAAQWSTAADLAALQGRKLADLLAWAAASVPAFADVAGAVRRLPGDGAGARELLAGLPVLRKDDLRRDPGRYRPRTPAGPKPVARRTGGSTGDPLHYLTDVRALSGQWAALLRAWEWSGWRFGDPMVTVGGGSVAPAGGGSFAQRVYDRLRRNRPLPAAELDDAGLDRAVDLLGGAGATVVYGYPSLLYGIARRALESGRDLRGPRGVITTSEMLFPGQRAILEETFGAPVFDVYGCNETNLVAGECDRHDGRHQAMESCLVEILDAEDRPVPAGTPGRIVATALDNRATAFIRYDTGDLGALETEPCPCGRGLVRIRDLQGRTRDLVRGADGRRIHGVAFNELMLGFPWVDRYQVVQSADASLVVHLASRVGAARGDVDALAGRLADLTGLSAAIDLDGRFETTAGAKARVIVSKLEDGRAD